MGTSQHIRRSRGAKWGVGLGVVVGAVVGPTLPAWAYDRNAAVNYAEWYWYSYNTDYQTQTNDCTNFMTQSIHAGGVPWMNHPQWNQYATDAIWDYTAAEWYMYGSYWPRWSSSAVNAHDSLNYLLSNYVASPQGDYWLGPAPSPAPSAPSGVLNGDPIYYDWQSDGLIDHATIKVGNGTDSYYGWQGDYINEHSDGYSRWHIQWTLTEVNPEWATTTAHTVSING